MRAPFVEDLPDQTQLLRGVNDGLKRDVLQLGLAPRPRVQQPLHVHLHEFQLALHLLLLDLEVLRLRRLGNSLQTTLELDALVLELTLHLPQVLPQLRAVVVRHRIHTGIICQGIGRPARLAPDVVRMAEAALRPLRVVVAHRLHLRNLLEELVQVLVGKIIQGRVETKPRQCCFSFRERPVDIVQVDVRSSR